MVKRAAVGRWCSSYVAEWRAMDLAVEVIKERRPRSVVVLTDSQALLRWLCEGGRVETSVLVARVVQGLADVRRELGTRVVLQWVPGHVGVRGNEWAGREANVAKGRDRRVWAWSMSVQRLLYGESWDLNQVCMRGNVWCMVLGISGVGGAERRVCCWLSCV